jgi:predicted NAD/FAD-binding protein
MRIAVIGSGIAGSSAAWALSEGNQVTVYEQDTRLGGHSHTVDIDYDGQAVSVDTGFIVYNEHNYPELTALFDFHAVETQESDMSFSVSADGGKFEWSGRGQTLLETLDGVFAQRRNLLRPSHLWMLREMSRFNRESVVDLKGGRLANRTLGEYLIHRRYSHRLIHDYLVPMGAAIWSTPVDRMLDFPAENFIAFFDNHRLLHVERPMWRKPQLHRKTFAVLSLSPAAWHACRKYRPDTQRRRRDRHARTHRYVRPCCYRRAFRSGTGNAR